MTDQCLRAGQWVLRLAPRASRESRVSLHSTPRELVPSFAYPNRLVFQAPVLAGVPGLAALLSTQSVLYVPPRSTRYHYYTGRNEQSQFCFRLELYETTGQISVQPRGAESLGALGHNKPGPQSQISINGKPWMDRIRELQCRTRFPLRRDLATLAFRAPELASIAGFSGSGPPYVTATQAPTALTKVLIQIPHSHAN